MKTTHHLLPWQKTRDRYQAEGYGLPESHPMSAEYRGLNREERKLRLAILAYLPHRTQDAIDQALQSRLVPAQMKTIYGEVTARMRVLEVSIEHETDHRTVVSRAIEAGLPVPSEVLEEYPDLRHAATTIAEAA